MSDEPDAQDAKTKPSRGPWGWFEFLAYGLDLVVYAFVGVIRGVIWGVAWLIAGIVSSCS